LEWFGENLKTPARFNRTNSKGFYRHLVRAILENYGHQVTVVSEARIGYVT